MVLAVLHGGVCSYSICRPPRYSIAYFCNPNYERTIKAIPGTYEKVGRKYEDVQSGEYIIGMLTATY